ncbi:unnamed protein product [Calypogeia fissa]
MTSISTPPRFGFHQRTSPQPQLTKLKSSKRVSWAVGQSLCQVRLFKGEDAPVMLGSVQNQQQKPPAKNLHVSKPTVLVPAPDTPTAVASVPPNSQPDHDISFVAAVPQISWRKPSRIDMDPKWRVTAGEDSVETRLQRQRELPILEAFYPLNLKSSIPESPLEPVEAQELYDDSTTPEIPLVSLEDEDEEQDENEVSSLLSSSHFNSEGYSGQVKDSVLGNGTLATEARPVDDPSDVTSGMPPPARQAPAGMLPEVHVEDSTPKGVQPDVEAAAAIAFAAHSTIQEMGSMIDMELLIRILKNPSILQFLTSKSSFSIAKSELPEMPAANMNWNGASRLPDKINQEQAMNELMGSAANDGINPPPTSHMTTGAVGRQEGGGSKSNESLTNAGMVALGQLNGLYNNNAQPVFGTSELNLNGSMPRGCAKHSSSKLGAQVKASTPLSRLDEEYFPEYVKGLIVYDGSDNNDSEQSERAASDKGSTGARCGNAYNAPEMKVWNGMEQFNPEIIAVQKLQGNGRTWAGFGVPVEAAAVPLKSRKVCIYFETPQGCHNGNTCAFIHDLSQARKRTQKTFTNYEPTQLHHAKRPRVGV